MIADQLKKAVLQAAIQGKLTEQLPEDGDARDLLKEIQEEKDRLIETGEIKKERPVAQLSEDDIPFEIPTNWCWCFLQDIAIKIHYGFTASAQPSGHVKMLRITDIQDNTVNWKKVPFCRISDDQLPSYILKNRDIVIARTGGTVGKTYIIKGLGQDSVFASYLIRVVLFNEVYEYYVKFFMESELYWLQLNDKSQGTGQPNVNAKALKGLLLPLPPLAEQQRIVEKLEEILPEIEHLSVHENNLDTLQHSFPGQMKSSILQAAIQGKLTDQLPEDGNARELLEEIKAEKDRLIKEGKIKKEKPLPDIAEDEIPFEIPDNWCWVRLNDLGLIIGGGTPKTEEKLNWDNGNIPWLTPADMKNVSGKYVKNGERFITNYGLIHSSAQLMPKGSVIFSSRAPIGYLAIADNPISTNQGFKSLVPYKSSMSEFIYFYLMAFTQEIQKLGSGTTFKEVSGSVMKKLIVPLPPLAEQQRIVHRLNELLAPL